MILLVKASLVLAILFVFYKLLLEKESFFAVNRLFLILSLALCFMLPLVELPELVNNQGIVDLWLYETSEKTTTVQSKNAPLLENEKSSSTDTVSTTSDSTQLSPDGKKRGLGFWSTTIYFFGLIVLTLNLLSQLIGLLIRIGRNKDRIYDGKYVIINSEEDSGPFSFFNYIFIDPEKYDSTTYELILEHEKIHVKKLHSLDLLLTEIFTIVLWFNPFVWLFRKETEKNIEYQTDAILLETQNIRTEKYQTNLLAIAVEKKPLAIISNYNQSLIKKRIVMMNKKKSNGHAYWKYAFIAPTLLVTILLLNQPFSVQAQDRIEHFNANENLGNESEYGDEEENDFDDNLPPLLKAAWEGEYDLVKKLINESADVNLLQEGEGTALTLAIRKEEFEIAKLLLENGADPNLGTSSDGHPLWLATRKGNVELVKLLVGLGSDVNTKFPGDGSALIQSCKMGNLEMVKVLIALKADINMPVEGDGNPLIMAAKGGHKDVVHYLVQLGSDINYEVLGDETPLINASEQGHLGIVKFLIEQGADVNKVCTEQLHDGTTRVRTALKMARKKGHTTITDYLESKGAKE